jgi:outer membrane cobalamin receptor
MYPFRSLLPRFTQIPTVVALATVAACALAFPSVARADSAIRGTVLDPDGRTVASAQVLVTTGGTVVARPLTGADGTFIVDALAADRYELHVTRAGFRAAPLVIDLAADERRDVTIHLHVSAVAESVVVSAAQVDLPLSRTPASVTVISRETLQAFQLDTVAGALRRVPGLSLSRNGGPGAVTSVFPRGGESDFTTVVIDGVPVNAFGGGFDFGHLMTGDVERIEVVRGPQSARWGGGAIGGVIQILTTPDAGERFDATIEAGSRDATRIAARGSAGAGAWRLAFGGGRATADGEVDNDDWRSEQIAVSAKRDEGALRALLFARTDRSERGNPGPYGSDPGGTYGGLDRVSRGWNESVTLGATVARRGGRVRPSASAGWTRLDSDYASPFGASYFDTTRVHARVQLDTRIAPRVEASAGAEWLREEAGSTFIAGAGATPLPLDRTVGAGYVEARLDGGPFFATAGVRVERIRRGALESNPTSFPPRPLLPADTVVAATPRVSAAWFVRPPSGAGWTRVRASAGLGIRPPDAFEIAFTDNPSLLPERSRSVDAGVEQAFAGGRLVAEATLFANEYDDMIVTVGRSLVDASRYQSDNIANARARGLELLVNARLPGGFSAAAAYTWLDAEVLAVDRLGVAPPPFLPGDALLRRPRHQAWIDAAWQGTRGSTFLTVGARGRTLDIDPSFGTFGGLYTNPGYTSVSAGAAWRLGAIVEAFGRVTNLFDRRYEEVFGFPAASRAVYAGLRLASRR